MLLAAMLHASAQSVGAIVRRSPHTLGFKPDSASARCMPQAAPTNKLHSQ